MPNYYSEIRPRLEKAGKDIANYRKDKDIGGEVDSLIDSAEDYDKVLEQMMNDLDIIESSIKTCVDFQNARLEKKTEEDKRANRSIAFGFAGAILGALVTYLVAK